VSNQRRDVMPIEPPEIPPTTPGNPTEPPPESPPGGPRPDVPPPLREPGEPPVPEELPGKQPDEFPVRGPNEPRTPFPETDVEMCDVPGSGRASIAARLARPGVRWERRL
jgi:hypothetical protein